MPQLSIEELIRRGLSHRAQRLSLKELEDLPVATWDIETCGFDADIDHMLCASIKPLHGKMTTFRIDDYKGFSDKRYDDSKLIKDVRAEAEKYLVLVHHYGDLFDIPFTNTRLVGWNMRPIRTCQQIYVDTWRLSRSRLHMRNNRLITLIEYLDTKTKKSSVNGRMWSRAMTGDKKGLDYVVKHNIADVKSLEEVLLYMAKFFTVPYRMYK